MVLAGLQIAMKELREKKIPFTIRRNLPDGRCVVEVCVRARARSLHKAHGRTPRKVCVRACVHASTHVQGMQDLPDGRVRLREVVVVCV